MHAVHRFKFQWHSICFYFLTDASPQWPACHYNLIIRHSTFLSFAEYQETGPCVCVCVCECLTCTSETQPFVTMWRGKTLNSELFFTLLIRKNQALYSRTHSRWWKHSQFWLWRQRCRPRQELHADMHAIRMIYANYAYYSQRNSSSNCQDKLPEISHKICRARSKRWRPLGKQGHSASGIFQVMMVAVTLPGCWGI